LPSEAVCSTVAGAFGFEVVGASVCSPFCDRLRTVDVRSEAFRPLSRLLRPSSNPAPMAVLKSKSAMSRILPLLLDHLATPLGDIVIVADLEGNLRATFWADEDGQVRQFLQRQYQGFQVEVDAKANPHGLTASIGAYFAGDLRAIDALPVETAGTSFQREVWRALREIPCGTTISYGELALRIGRPEAVRAVGAANGANPVGVVVPCHRVIGANGSLTGYGGGIERKRWLLEHERQMRL
jgi:methylated-DNA-[protein]-cysteine S-methyltransferase